MPFYAKVDDFLIPAQKTSGNIIISGIPFTPRAAFYLGGSFTDQDNVVASGHAHFLLQTTVSGAYHSLYTKVAGGQTLDNNGTSPGGSFLYDYRSIVNLFGGDLDTYAFTASGVNLVVDRAYWPVRTKVTYLFLGGDDLVKSYVGNYSGLTGTGFINVTAPGFQPDVLIEFSMYNTSMNVYSSSDNCSVGWATSSGNQGGLAWIEKTSTPTDGDTIAFNDAIAEKITLSETVSTKIQFVEFTSSGFLLNQTQGGTGYHRYAALKGGKWAVGNLNTSTVSGTIINNTIGFEPQAVLFLSALKPYASGISVPNSQSFGVATKDDAKVWSDYSKVGVNPTKVYYAHFDNVYANLVEDNIVGLMDWNGIIESGFSTIMTLPDISENFVTYLAFGETNQPVRSKQSAWVYGKTFDSHPAWVYGHDPNGLEYRAYTKGAIENYSSSKSAFVAGGIVVNDNVSAYVDFKIPAIFSRTGYFNVDPTKTVGEYLTISGLDFQPKLLMLWWTGGWIPSGINMHNLNDWPGDSDSINVGFGAATDSTHRFAVVSTAVNNTLGFLTNAHRSQNNTEIMRTYTLSGNARDLDGILDFHSFDSDGYTLIYDDQFNNSYSVGYLAIGGSGLSDVYVDYGTLPTATGIFEISNVGFKPDALILTTQAQTTVIDEEDHGLLSFGWSDGTNQMVISLFDKDGVSTSVSKKYQSEDKIYATIDPTSYTVTSYGNFVNFTPSGFILNNQVGTSPNIFNYIALKGGLYKSLRFLSGTQSGTTYTVSGIGFKPTTLMMAGICYWNNNTIANTEEISMGFTTIDYGQESYWRGFNEIAQYIYSYDGSSGGNTWWNLSDISYFNSDFWGLLDVLDFNNDGFTFTMLDYDDGSYVHTLAVGPGGKALSNIHSYVEGREELTDNINAFTEGTQFPLVRGHIDAYVRGSSELSSSKACYLFGNAFSTSTISAYVEVAGEGISSISSYIYGRVNTTTSKSCYTAGEIRYSKTAFTEGYLPNQSVKPAYVLGSDLKFGPDIWIS